MLISCNVRNMYRIPQINYVFLWGFCHLWPPWHLILWAELPLRQMQRWSFSKSTDSWVISDDDSQPWRQVLPHRLAEHRCSGQNVCSRCSRVGIFILAEQNLKIGNTRIQADTSRMDTKKISSPCQPLFSLPLHINSKPSTFLVVALLWRKSVFHAKDDVGRPADGAERCSRQGRTVHIYYSIWVLLNNKRVSHDDLKWVLWHEASRCRNRQGTGHPSALSYPSGTII